MNNINLYVKEILACNNINKNTISEYTILHDTTIIKKYHKFSKDELKDYIETLIIVTPDDCPVFVYNVYMDDYGQCYYTQYYRTDSDEENSIGLGTYNPEYIEECLSMCHLSVNKFVIEKLSKKYNIKIDAYHGDLCIYKDDKRIIIYNQWSIDKMYDNKYSAFYEMEKLVKQNVSLLN